ncbi:LLM class flavin-dependent oxidoreductase, partial [Nocardia sp.]|uniref:LLM class flavin-dependent oxidoreductase n=1 Tax=Nocardia sp. TaxID=1821 RepID=UPI00258D517D
MTAQRGFRFGVNMVVPKSRAAWVEKCRRAEELGYDVIGIADHLGVPAPFPAMILAAEATQRVRLNTFVLNTPFYNPTLLARDVATADLFTGRERDAHVVDADVVAGLGLRAVALDDVDDLQIGGRVPLRKVDFRLL